MKHALINVSLANVFSQEREPTVLLGQVLFGELCQVLQKKGDFVFIHVSDELEGWIHSHQYVELSREAFESIRTENPTYSYDVFSTAISADDHIPIIYGSRLPHFDGLSFKIKKQKIVYNGQVFSPSFDTNMERIKKVALKYVNSPELRNGISPFGIDNIGLVTQCFKFLGKQLPHSISKLRKTGKQLSFISEVEIGDIIIIESTNNLLEPAICLGENEVIYCYGFVQICAIDSFGIIAKNNKQYHGKIVDLIRIS